MAKTYNTFTNVATGDTLTATNFNNVLTNIAGYRVPAACMVRRTADLGSYSSGTDITWSSAGYDTESPSDPMFAAGSPTLITIRTAGLYALNLVGKVTAVATLTSATAAIYKSGNPLAMTQVAASLTTETFYSIYATASLSVGDTVTARVFPIGGSSYTITGNATETQTQTRFSVAWIGQTS